MLFNWIRANFKLLRYPQDIIGKKDEASLGKAAALLLTSTIISGILTHLIEMITVSVIPVSAKLSNLVFSISGFAITMGITFAILLLFVLSSITIFAIAKLMHGKGTFTQQFYLTTLPFSILLVLQTLTLVVPIVGGFLSLLLSFYFLHVLATAIGDLHKLSMRHSYATVFAGGIIGAMVWLFLFVTALQAYLPFLVA